MIKQCIMCKQEFEDKDVDFVGRCTPCFHKYMAMSDDEKRLLKGDLGVPFTPGYDSTWKK